MHLINLSFSCDNWFLFFSTFYVTCVVQGRPLKKKNQIHIDSIKVVEKVDDEEEFVGKANVFQVDRLTL